MRIASLVLDDFLLVKDSGIKEIHITFTEDVQLLIGSNGSGKAQPLDSLIKTPEGWCSMGDIQLHSKIANPDGTHSFVTGIHPQGLKDIYRITFEDGRTAECCDDHLWRIYSVLWGTSNYKGTGRDTTENRWRTVSFRDIRINHAVHNYKAGLFVPLTQPVFKADVNLPIDPYVLGVILGDAHLAEGSIVISNPDQFIIDEVSKLLPDDFQIGYRSNPLSSSIIKSTSYDKYQKSDFLEILRDLKLTGTHSHTKFIPDIYMNASPAQRLSLVQGLLDTDGTVGKKGSTQYCTTSPHLAKQFQELIRSLGGLCKISEKHPIFTHKGERREGRLAYILNVRIKDAKQLFRLPRKKDRIPDNYQYNDRLRLRIKHIDYIGKKESQCITVDHSNQLYITNDYVVTHNSSCLRQLSPFPSVRSLFGKKGLKVIVLEKDGMYYKLESEYAKPSSPHLFYQGDSEENLNIGRTTETQRELIEEHLGITPLVNDLMMNTYQFPKWTPSKRKDFLMWCNPDQIGFILTLIKQTSSKIKACKNNISRLNARKILLEQDLIDDETMITLTQEKETLGNDLGDFQQNLMDIEVGLRTIPSNDYSFSLTDLPAVKKTIKRCHYQLSALSHVNRDDDQRQLDRENVLSQLAVGEQKLKEYNEQILEQSSELFELETRYRELAVEGDLKTIDETISRLEIDRDKLAMTRPPFELSEDELTTKYKELEILDDKLQFFSNLSVTLLSRKKRQRREWMLQTVKHRQSTYQMRLNDLQSQFDSLSKRHKLTPRDIPDSPCAKDACPLYAHFMGEYKNTQGQRQSLEESLKLGRRATKRLNAYADALIRQLQDTKPYADRIQWLAGYARSNPILHHVLRQMDILSTLSTNPNRITRQLHDAYDRIAQWLRLKSVLSDLETAYAFKSRQISAESHDTIKLVSSIDSKKASLYALRSAITTTTGHHATLTTLLNDITSFSSIKSTIVEVHHHHAQIAQALAHTHEKDKLLLLQRAVTNLRSHHFTRMSEIEHILRAQSGLRERYQEEVMEQLFTIEKELADLQQIETALIPIPKESMIDFINTVFKQANRLIASIWTVPLQIDLLSADSPLDYSFTVSGDNESSREMSECSEGQTEVLSLAINLSLRIILGHTNYPLCLDEPGRTMDSQHASNLIILLKQLLDSKVISQLFMVSHHASIHNNFIHTETFVVRPDNILLPLVYNEHVTLK